MNISANVIELFFYKNKKIFAVIFDNIVYLNFINLQIFKLFF